jgi:hypothetical protein
VLYEVYLVQMISAETITGSDHLPGDEDNGEERIRSKKQSPSFALSAENLDSRLGGRG